MNKIRMTRKPNSFLRWVRSYFLWFHYLNQNNGWCRCMYTYPQKTGKPWSESPDHHYISKGAIFSGLVFLPFFIFSMPFWVPVILIMWICGAISWLLNGEVEK